MEFNDYYKLVDADAEGSLSCWFGQTNQYDEVVGYSVLGHIFLRSSVSNEYSVLHPFQRSMKQYGVFGSEEEFCESILMDFGFIDYVINPDHVRKIKEISGSLNDEENEIYIPCPYPMVGGSCEPNTYQKGNVWVFLDLVGQTHGI